jgi:hypothetical protein
MEITNSKRNLANRKWLMIIAMIIGIGGGISAEWTWFFRIKYGYERPIIVDFLKDNENIKRITGNVKDVDIKQIYSKYSFRWNGNNSGRYRFIITGDKTQIDVFVYWHDGGSSRVVIDEVDTVDSPAKEVLWRRKR